MIITLKTGERILTRKPVTFTQRNIPGTPHHRRYIVITDPGRGVKTTREVAIRDLKSISGGTKQRTLERGCGGSAQVFCVDKVF